MVVGPRDCPRGRWSLYAPAGAAPVQPGMPAPPYCAPFTMSRH